MLLCLEFNSCHYTRRFDLTQSINNDPPTLSSPAPSENIDTPSVETPTLSSHVPNENVGIEEVSGNE